MRLWHQQLIKKLPRQQLLGQWRECIALLGGGWGKKHRTVDYVFTYLKQDLADYSFLIASEMQARGYKPKLDYLSNYKFNYRDDIIYKEHDKIYMKECLENLKNKGIQL